MKITVKITFKTKDLKYSSHGLAHTTREIKIDNIDIKSRKSDIPDNNSNLIDQIINLTNKHNYSNSDNIHDELNPYITKLKAIIDAYDNSDKGDSINNIDDIIKYSMLPDSVEFKDITQSSDEEYCSDAEKLNSNSIYVAKLYVSNNPDYLYIISKNEHDGFCCHSDPTYQVELPKLLTTIKPNLVNYYGHPGSTNCRTYKLNWDEYSYSIINEVK